eukprot:SAG22_NODE_165_length_16780_cov_57.761525_1_plen_293_part_00
MGNRASRYLPGRSAARAGASTSVGPGHRPPMPSHPGAPAPGPTGAAGGQRASATQLLTKLEAAHQRLLLAMLVQHSTGAAADSPLFELAPAIAALIKGVDPLSVSESVTFKARFCPFQNAGGFVTLNVSPVPSAQGGPQPGALRQIYRKRGSAVAKAALQKYLRDAPHGACAAALKTNKKAAKQLNELIDSAEQVTFTDLGCHNICEYRKVEFIGMLRARAARRRPVGLPALRERARPTAGSESFLLERPCMIHCARCPCVDQMEYEYNMWAEFDGYRLTSRWQYEMYDSYD